MKSVRRLTLLLLLAGTACNDGREEALRAELTRLREERVEKSVAERAQLETREAEGAAQQAREELEAAREGLLQQEAKATALRAAVAAEVERNGRLTAELSASDQSIRAELRRIETLDREISRIRKRATLARTQGETLAREIRAEDPEWATDRRLEALAEFLDALAEESPQDPVLARLAEHSVARVRESSESAATAGAALAKAASERLAFVYGIEPEREDERAGKEEPPG